MLETVELPARVANLDSSLPDMDGETFPHFWDGGWCKVLVLVLVRDGGWCKVVVVVFEAGARCAANPRLSRAGRMLKMAEAGRGRSRFFETEVSGKSQLWFFFKCVNQLFVL